MNKGDDVDLHSFTDQSLKTEGENSNGEEKPGTRNREKRHREEPTGEVEGTVGVAQRRYMPDGYPDLGPMPSLGIPHWCYTMDTVITDLLSDTKYTVRDYVEGRVDEDGHVIKKTKESNCVTKNQ